MTREEALQFLAALQAVSNAYGIVVDGCGCHGSPWMEKRTDGVYVLDTEFGEDEHVTYPSFRYVEPDD